MNISRESRAAKGRNALAMRKSEEKLELLLDREWRRDAATALTLLHPSHFLHGPVAENRLPVDEALVHSAEVAAVI